MHKKVIVKDNKESAFKYKHNLFRVIFVNGTEGFMVADSREELIKFYDKRLGKGKVKSILPVLFGVVESEVV